MDTTSGQSVRALPAIVIRRPVPPVTRVVVGVDGSAGSAAALRWAAAEACRRETVLRIVSAWDEPRKPRPPHVGDPAQSAVARVQKALARVLRQPRYPRRIACATPKGPAAEALLNEAGDSGLLVLGAAGADAAPVHGRIARYCLQRGRGPLVLVPARLMP